MSYETDFAPDRETSNHPAVRLRRMVGQGMDHGFHQNADFRTRRIGYEGLNGDVRPTLAFMEAWTGPSVFIPANITPPGARRSSFPSCRSALLERISPPPVFLKARSALATSIPSGTLWFRSAIGLETWEFEPRHLDIFTFGECLQTSSCGFATLTFCTTSRTGAA